MQDAVDNLLIAIDSSELRATDHDLPQKKSPLSLTLEGIGLSISLKPAHRGLVEGDDDYLLFALVPRR